MRWLALQQHLAVIGGFQLAVGLLAMHSAVNIKHCSCVF